MDRASWGKINDDLLDLLHNAEVENKSIQKNEFNQKEACLLLGAQLKKAKVVVAQGNEGLWCKVRKVRNKSGKEVCVRAGYENPNELELPKDIVYDKNNLIKMQDFFNMSEEIRNE